MPRIGIAGCKHTTVDLFRRLSKFFDIGYIITLDYRTSIQANVSGYKDPGIELRSELGSSSTQIYYADKYSLNSDKDMQAILDMDLDVLLVMGWQRLIPEWLLTVLSVGAFGMHGSSKPLPHGRGRSPLNWSLIQGKQLFYTHLFKYKPGVDDGDIVGVKTFDINHWDDCTTLHHKNMLCMADLCIDYLPGLMAGAVKLYPQSSHNPTYYPKRSPEDGLLDWSRSCVEIYNHIRAVKPPFPGAFTFIEDCKIYIDNAHPFDTQLSWEEAQVGEVVEVFHDGSFVVKCGFGSLIVRDRFSGITKGTLLHNGDMKIKSWEGLPE